MKKLMKLPRVEFLKNCHIPNTKGLQEYENKRPRFLLESDFYVLINGKVHIIPAGFKYDHASVPRGLWNTFPPYDPLYAGAACLHDWCYAGEFFPREYADKLFLSAMQFTGVPKAKRGLMYIAVRIGGAFTYKKHTIKTVMEVRELSGITEKKRPLWKAA